MKNLLLTALSFIFISFCCWISIVCIDFSFSEQGKAPLFAKCVNTTDSTLYKGLGYTIEVGYESIDGNSSKTPKSYFYFCNPFRS